QDPRKQSREARRETRRARRSRLPRRSSGAGKTGLRREGTGDATQKTTCGSAARTPGRTTAMHPIVGAGTQIQRDREAAAYQRRRGQITAARREEISPRAARRRAMIRKSDWDAV